jgi:phosphatidate cytidylyltransferase
MNAVAARRLFGWQDAFAHPVTVGLTLTVVALLVVAAALIWGLHAIGRTSDQLHDELLKRVRSWAVIAPLLIVPVLLGAAWTIGAVALLSVLCYREFARATGLFRFRLISVVVVLGIACITFAVVDHWYGFFVALPPLTIVLIAIVAILRDQPKGYTQRVGLGAVSFLFFGVCLGHLGYIANDPDYRPIIMMIIATVELNDVFAYVCGKTFGRRKLVPNTSPKKTLGGALGALVFTTALVAVLAHYVFQDSRVDTVAKLIGLGLIVSVAGQFGDLMLSSIKRDIGIKDMAATIPGHGGFLDRFDSLLLVAPAVFHYVGFFRGFGLEEPTRILSGGG